ncbi:hypothetical protein LSH36_61g07013 [Paralvinella palmiformis]|uniref:Uncharacterized protein n=1 Tax=Paralvinella palmiformis TaxID=53620 RepID=A0AAD9K5X5_9ANNE|nr:hypothetical protein LSH36_61g07013 [Paralvinella palmiformis]
MDVPVHGRADTGMREMAENLRREEENLCGQRGLVPNTEQQTFQISAQSKLRNQYDKIIRPIFAEQAAAGARAQPLKEGGAGHLDARTEKCQRAYQVLNKFLQAFVDHLSTLTLSHYDLIFLTEHYDSDSGHAFDSVLLFGHENTLIIFEILTFAVIDMVSGSYVLSAVIVYIFIELFHTMRDGLGRSNLAKKTLVDKRFLI